MNFYQRFKFAWRYASAGKFMAWSGRRNRGALTIASLLAIRDCQLRGESAIMAFPNGNIYTEKAHQNEIDRLKEKYEKN